MKLTDLRDVAARFLVPAVLYDAYPNAVRTLLGTVYTVDMDFDYACNGWRVVAYHANFPIRGSGQEPYPLDLEPHRTALLTSVGLSSIRLVDSAGTIYLEVPV